MRELLKEYITHTEALARCGVLPDTSLRAIHLYGASDAAAALWQRFGVDVSGIPRSKQ